MTILENNASQSVATADGYMTGRSSPDGRVQFCNALIWWQMMLFT